MPGIEPATFPRAPHEIAAHPMSHPAIAQWVGGCLTSHSGEGRGLNPRGGSHLGPFHTRNRDFGATKGSGGIGLGDP